jgi:hypothetical protein
MPDSRISSHDAGELTTLYQGITRLDGDFEHSRSAFSMILQDNTSKSAEPMRGYTTKEFIKFHFSTEHSWEFIMVGESFNPPV